MMNSFFKKILFTTFIIANLNFNSYSSENKILIKVNNEIITSYDILIEVNYLELINKNFKNLSKNQSIEIAKNSLIREKVKEIELNKFLSEIKVEDEKLNEFINNYFKKFGINSISNFDEYFASQGINPEIIKKKITLELIWNQFIYARFNNRVKIDKIRLKDEIQKNNKQKEYLLSEIFFNLEKNEKIEDKFRQIKQKIEEIGFSDTALTFSKSDSSKNGGKLGWVKSSVLSEDIKKTLNNLNIGDYSNPIILPSGFLILKIENLKEVEKTKNIEDELKFIIKKQTEQQLNQFSNIYIKKIKKDVRINEL